MPERQRYFYKIKYNEMVTTIPAMGCNVEIVSPTEGVTLTVLDIRGQDRIRPLWRHYFSNVDGIAYVVDSSDFERLEEAREELFNMLESEELRGVPIVVLANKQDMLGALTASEITQHLHLNMLTGRNWYVQQTSAMSGKGLYDAMKQLVILRKEFADSKR